MKRCARMYRSKTSIFESTVRREHSVATIGTVDKRGYGEPDPAPPQPLVVVNSYRRGPLGRTTPPVRLSTTVFRRTDVKSFFFAPRSARKIVVIGNALSAPIARVPAIDTGARATRSSVVNDVWTADGDR
uniref:Uncharacterized protein n=1 Tax=Sipha flava TaxID=143950 RepID=A0A2S2R3D2_9HEMI